MLEKQFSYEWCPHVKMIGCPSGALKILKTQSPYIQFDQNKVESKLSSGVPLVIVCHLGTMALIDQKGSLWILGNVFCEPINLSELIKIKAKRVFMGSGQLIFESKKKGFILITWASKAEFKSQKLRKLVVTHSPWSHLIDAFAIELEIQQGSLWNYSTVKNLDNEVKLYQLNILGEELVSLPTDKKMKIPEKPVGMSVSKNYGLIWTNDGRLWGWGCKNLGLGLSEYSKSFYEELQEIQIEVSIIKAIATNNYSIALGSNGLIYEWGIKSNRDPILSPQILHMNGLNFVNIQGYEDCYGGLTSTNQLYLWGKGLESIFDLDQDTKVQEPFHVHKDKGVKITDFNIQENYITVVIASNKGQLSSQEHQYFGQVLRKVTTKWLPKKMENDHKNIISKRVKHKTPSCTPDFFKSDDYIDRLMGQKKSKQKYFLSVKDQEKIFRSIMNESANPYTLLRTQMTIERPTTRQMSSIKRKITHKKIQSARVSPTILVDEEAAIKILNQHELDQKRKRRAIKRAKMPVNTKSHQFLSYEQRRINASQKKEQLQMSKLQQASSKRREIIRNFSSDNNEQQQKIRFISNYLKKMYIVKLLTTPLVLAKKIKVKQKMNEKCFERVSSNMKGILHRQRALGLLKKLMTNHPQTYKLLKKVAGDAIRRWKHRKQSRSKKTLISALVVFSLSQRIQYGLGDVWLKVRKIQKVQKWFKEDRMQRMNQLRNQWKRSLLLFIKPTPSFQNKSPLTFKEEINYKFPLDKPKLTNLSTYMKYSAIFHLKLPSPVTLTVLRKNKKKQNDVDMSFGSSTQPITRKRTVWAKRSQADWKNQTSYDNEKKFTPISGIVDILLYSQHYDSFFKPKNCQINIPDNMKHTQRWYTEQRKIFFKILKDIIYEQWKIFYQERRQYEFKLALFVRDNYDRLAEHRWKYILEFNQLSQQKKGGSEKKERELRRLLKMTGSEMLLMEDVIPQKNRMLDNLSQLKGAPVAPVFQVQFGNMIFKKKFKEYYEQVSTRAKYMRKYFN